MWSEWSTFVTYGSLFSRLSASVTQNQSRVARKTGHNRSRHRATPAKVSVVIVWSLNGKHTESMIVLQCSNEQDVACSLISSAPSTNIWNLVDHYFTHFIQKKLLQICCIIDNTTYFSYQDINIILISHKIITTVLCKLNPTKIAYVYLQYLTQNLL